MKSIIKIFIGLSVFFIAANAFCNIVRENQPLSQPGVSGNQALSIVNTAELSGLTDNWVNEFGKLNPDLKISTKKISDPNWKEVSNLTFVTDEYQNAVENESAWKMVIGKDAIVPVINSSNPFFEKILAHGFTDNDFNNLLSGSGSKDWSAFIPGGMNAPINIYMIDNEYVKNRIAQFAMTDPEKINAKLITGQEDFLMAIKNDVYSIGFCKLTGVLNKTTNNITDKICFLSIDRNKNGRIDYFENIYGSMDAFTRGIWIGKYPAVLCGNIYALAPARPADKNEIAFLSWIIGGGQKLLSSNGYGEMAGIQKQSGMEALLPNEVFADNTVATGYSHYLLIGLFAVVVIGLIITILVLLKREKSEPGAEGLTFASAMNENSISAPAGLFFDKSHTWAFMEKNGMVRLGIDDFLQHITGQITQVKLKMAGDMVRKGEKMLTIIHNGKQLNLYAPVTGTIIEHNLKLITESAIINSSPYSEGWVYMIEPRNWIREIQFMFMSDSYKEWLSDEFTRLKDFFAASFRVHTPAFAHSVLQDGGEICDNVLADLEPEVWEDFQTNFIDKSK